MCRIDLPRVRFAVAVRWSVGLPVFRRIACCDEQASYGTGPLAGPGVNHTVTPIVP